MSSLSNVESGHRRRSVHEICQAAVVSLDEPLAGQCVQPSPDLTTSSQAWRGSWLLQWVPRRLHVPDVQLHNERWSYTYPRTLHCCHCCLVLLRTVCADDGSQVPAITVRSVNLHKQDYSQFSTKAGIPQDWHGHRYRHGHRHPHRLPREYRHEDVGVSGDFPATSRTRTMILDDLSADLSDSRAFPCEDVH